MPVPGYKLDKVTEFGEFLIWAYVFPNFGEFFNLDTFAEFGEFPIWAYLLTLVSVQQEKYKKTSLLFICHFSIYLF